MNQITDLYGRWFPRKVGDGLILEGPESALIFSNYKKLQYAAVLVASLINEKNERLYTGRLRGSRTSMTKRVLKNVDYWFKRIKYNIHYPWFRLEVTRNGVDTLGNPYMSLVVEHAGERFYVQVFSVMASTLVAGRFARLIVKLFPRWHSYLKDKFDVYCMTKMRIYVDPDAYVDVPVYTFKVTTGVIEGYDPSAVWEKEGNRGTRVNYFRPEYQIPGS